jgi:hypothetical protein
MSDSAMEYRQMEESAACDCDAPAGVFHREWCSTNNDTHDAERAVVQEVK